MLCMVSGCGLTGYHWVGSFVIASGMHAESGTTTGKALLFVMIGDSGICYLFLVPLTMI